MSEQFSRFAMVVLLAMLAVDPQVQQAPTPSPTYDGIHHATVLPSGVQLLDARITQLERQVVELQAQMKGYQTHVHTFFGQRNPSTYMSIHDLANAMQPHSNTPTTQYYVPLMLSPDKQPGVGAIRLITSTPEQSP